MKNNIIMMAGLPGTGKSTTAEILRNELDYDIYSILETRRKLGHKKFRVKQNPIVFQKMYDGAEESLSKGRGIILDNSYTKQDGRIRVYEISLDYDTNVLIIECLCSEKESKNRMRKRPKGDGLVVEPRNPKAYDRMAERWQRIEEDIDSFPHYPLSLIKYNTESNEIWKVKVSPNVYNLVNVVDNIAAAKFVNRSSIYS